jgi:hypothetical protein
MFCHGYHLFNYGTVCTSVADPDPYVFGPPGSRSIRQRNGSGSFYHQEKIVIKTLNPTVLWLLFDLFSLKNYVNDTYWYLQKVISRKTFFLIIFLLVSWMSMTKIAGSGFISQRHGSADPDPDPDPHQNAMDPPNTGLYVFTVTQLALLEREKKI